VKLRKSTPPIRLAQRLRQFAVALTLSALAAAAMGATDPKASRLYEDALLRFEKGDHAGAVVQLKNVLQIDRNLLQAHVLLGMALLKRNEVVASEVAFNDALKLGVNRAEVVVPLAKAMLGQGKRQAVLDDTRFAMSGLPNGVRMELLLQMASANADLGRPKDAMKVVEQAREINPSSPEPWLASVPIHIRARQFSEAMAAADKAVLLAPTSADAAYLRGSVWHTQGNLAKAVVSYSKALELQPTHLESLLARAGIALDQNRNADARKDLSEARRVSPDEPRAVYMGAVLADREGDPKAARAALVTVTNLVDPVPIEFLRYNQQVLILAGLAHHGLGQLEKAKPYLEMVQREQPGSPVSKLLGQIHLTDKNVDKAIESLEGYLRSFPSDTQALSLLAAAQMSKGRHARATQILRDALKVNDKPELHSILGMSLVRGGKSREARAELEVAYSKNPALTQAGATLVGLYLDEKLFKKAIDTAKALVKRNPSQPTLHNLLGIAHEYSGDAARARTAFEQAAKLDPAYLDPQLNLARLDIASHKDDAASVRLSQLLKIDDKHVETLILTAQFQAQRGNVDEATRLYTKAADLSTGPSDLKALFALFEYQLRTGHIVEATEVAMRLSSKAPEDVMVLLANARATMAAKTPELAWPILVNASRQANFDTDLLNKIALLQVSAGDAKAAAYTLSKALQSDPDHVPSQALLAEAEIHLGDLSSAERRARDLIRRQPKLGIGHALLGDVAATQGQWAAAIAAHRESHRLQPTSDSALRLMRLLAPRDLPAATQLAELWLKSNPRDLAVRRLQADNLVLAGNMLAARASYEQLLKVSPNNADALNNYAHVLLALKDVPAASKAAAAALAAKPAAPNIIGTAGWVALQAGQNDRALQLLRDARLRDPANADTRYFLASALAKTGRIEEAKVELKAALQYGDKFATAKEAQTLLKALN
jgi:cellulose synthase operon protein C